MPAEMITPRISFLAPTLERRRFDAVFLDVWDYAESVFKKWTKDWKPEHQPEWDVSVKTSGSDRWLEFKTSSVPFVYVDQGTDPYTITKSTGLGPFQVNYVPKTKPGMWTTGQSSTSGPWVQPKEVHHPGIKARNITGMVTDAMEKYMHTLLGKPHFRVG